MAERLVYLNGEFVPESRAAISVFDAGINYGAMVFELTRTFGHVPFRLREHMQRLSASMKFFDIDIGMTIEELESVTLETIAVNRENYSKDIDFTITHNISSGPLSQFAAAFGGVRRPTVCIHTWPVYPIFLRWPEDLYDRGVRAVITAQRTIPARLIDPKVKNRSRAHYWLADNEAHRRDPEAVALLMDEDGFIAEGAGSNFMIVKDGTLISPEPRNILLGCTRRALADVAADLGIPFKEANFGLYEVLQADEAFFCTTSVTLAPCVAVEGRTIGTGKPGPIARGLLEGTSKAVGLDIIEQGRHYAKMARGQLQVAVATAR